MSADPYEKGKKDMLSELCNLLYNNLGLSLPKDSCANFVNKLACILVERPCLLKLHRLNCKLSDLFSLSHDLHKIIERVQQRASFEGRLKLLDLKIEVKLNSEEFVNAEKSCLASQFVPSDLSGDEYLEIIENLSQQILNLRNSRSLPSNFNELSFMFESLVKEKAEILNESNESFQETIGMFTIDMAMAKFKRQKEKMIKDKEWENQEIKNLKGRYQIKKRKLEIKKEELREMERELKKKNVDVEKDKAELERLKTNYYKEKNKLIVLIDKKSSMIIETVDNISSSLNGNENNVVSSMTESDTFSDTSSIITDSDFGETHSPDLDIKILQQRLAECELQSKSDSSEQLQREIDNLRTHIVQLRSANAIKSSLSHQKRYEKLKNSRHSLTENRAFRKMPGAPTMTPRVKLTLSNSALEYPIRTFASTPKSTSQGFNFFDISSKDLNDDSSALKKLLRAKEIKLAEKEEDLEKERINIMNNWKKLPMANELIPMVQTEILELRKAKDEYKKKAEAVERKELGLCEVEEGLKKLEEQMKEKERDVELKNEKLDTDRADLIQKLQKLKEDLQY